MHIAGEHRRDGDPPLPELRSKTFQIGRHCRLARGIGRFERDPAQACHARYADDMAASPPQHRRQNGLDDIDHAEKIDAHDFLELNDLEIVDCRGATNSSTRDQNISRSKCANDFLNSTPHLLTLSDINDRERTSRSSMKQLVRKLLQLGLVTVDEADARATASK